MKKLIWDRNIGECGEFEYCINELMGGKFHLKFYVCDVEVYDVEEFEFPFSSHNKAKVQAQEHFRSLILGCVE